MRSLFLYCILFLAFKNCYSQAKDTTIINKEVHKAIYSQARKATIFSAIIPGLGQAYNHKYWKIPVIYAALGGLSYWGLDNYKNYKFYSDNLRAENDDDPNTLNSTTYSSGDLITQKNYHKKYRDIAIMLGTLVYVINIIDANVDAHLKTFDVSDDLSLGIKPYTNLSYNNHLQGGLTLSLHIK